MPILQIWGMSPEVELTLKKCLLFDTLNGSLFQTKQTKFPEMQGGRHEDLLGVDGGWQEQSGEAAGGLGPWHPRVRGVQTRGGDQHQDGGGGRAGAGAQRGQAAEAVLAHVASDPVQVQQPVLPRRGSWRLSSALFRQETRSYHFISIFTTPMYWCFQQRSLKLKTCPYVTNENEDHCTQGEYCE